MIRLLRHACVFALIQTLAVYFVWPPIPLATPLNAGGLFCLIAIAYAAGASLEPPVEKEVRAHVG